MTDATRSAAAPKTAPVPGAPAPGPGPATWFAGWLTRGRGLDDEIHASTGEVVDGASDH